LMPFGFCANSWPTRDRAALTIILVTKVAMAPIEPIPAATAVKKPAPPELAAKNTAKAVDIGSAWASPGAQIKATRIAKNMVIR